MKWDAATYAKLENAFRQVYLQEQPAEVGPHWQADLLRHVRQIAAEKDTLPEKFMQRFIVVATVASAALLIWLNMQPECEMWELYLQEPLKFFWIASWWL